MQLKGINGRKSIPVKIENMICAEFCKPIPFNGIANQYGFSTTHILTFFDDHFSYVSRRALPKILCVDEKHFLDESGSKYCCILYDFTTKELVDVLRSRKLDFLDDYFANISRNERENVKVLVSDMNDTYSTIAKRYFKQATHIIDLFHVVRLLTSAVNIIRIKASKRTDKNSLYYRFMKKHWKLFLCRSKDIPDKFYNDKSSAHPYHFDDMVFDCVKSDRDLLVAYRILQDFYDYYQKNNFDEAMKFVDFMIQRMEDSDIDELKGVSKTFKKWKAGIAVSITRSQNRIHCSNSAAENCNTHIEMLIRVSYGYRNFERFCKHIPLIRSAKNQKIR